MASPVCPKCGWYASFPSHTCNPDHGAAADALAAAVDIPSTKLGYGHGRLTFKFNSKLTLILNVADRGFTIDDIYDHKHHSAEDIAELLNAIGSTKIGRGGLGRGDS